MRAGVGVVLAAACLWAAADSVTVNSVVETVRTALRKKHKDAEVAAALAGVQVSGRLEDRVLEILESEGAGPQTLGALQHLRDISRDLPPAAPPRGMEPPPAPSTSEEFHVWEEATAKALDYIASLPDFICSETVHRWVDPTGKEAWQPVPTVTADLTYFDRKEQYGSVMLAGAPVNKDLLDVGGAMSQGEFGTLLRTIFAPSPDKFYRFDHWTVLRKRPTCVYLFRIAASHAPGTLVAQVPGTGARIETAAGERGYVYIDRDTRSVTRIVAEAVEIPADFPIQAMKAVLDYDYASIGGRPYLLPLRAEIRIDSRSTQNLNAVEFGNYRKFSTETSVQFVDKR